MRFRLGPIPENPEFQPGLQGWLAIKEPSPWLMQLIAIPIGILITVALASLWFFLIPIFTWDRTADVSLLIWIPGVVMLHEMVHAAFHPGFATGPDSILGFWPSKLLFYAHYEAGLSRNRFLAVLTGPFVVLSLLPLLLCIALQHASWTLFLISVFNALFASGDLLGVVLLLSQIPKSATVRNKGWRTYYQIVEPSPEPSKSG